MSRILTALHSVWVLNVLQVDSRAQIYQYCVAVHDNGTTIPCELRLALADLGDSEGVK